MASRTPFSTAGMYWRGMAPPTTSSWKAKPSPRPSGSMRRWHTRTGRGRPTASCSVPRRRRRHGDRLAVGDDGRSSRSTVTPNCGVQPLEGDGQVDLAGHAEHGLVGLVDAGRPASDGILLAEPLQGGHELVVVGPRRGPDGHRQRRRLGLGEGMTTGVPLGARVSPVACRSGGGRATKSPATASSTGEASLPRSTSRTCSRSSVRVRGLVSTASGRTVPETTLHSEIRPACWSASVLQTASSGGRRGRRAPRRWRRRPAR